MSRLFWFTVYVR